jgi:CBS domain containing-hemolysin-like protein
VGPARRYARRAGSGHPTPATPGQRTDEIDTALGLLAVFCLILANGFFVAVEFALVAVDRDGVRVDASRGRRGARSTENALRRLSFNLSGAQLGITITSLVIGFIAEPTVATVLEPLVGEVVGEGRALGVSIVLALALATLVQMLLGELVPKSFAIAKPRPTAYALAAPMLVYTRVAGPLISFLNGAANWTVRRLGIEPQEELASVRSLEELELLIRSSGESGTLEPEALNLLTRTIRFGDKVAADALVPRVSVEAVSVEGTVADLAARSVQTGHSRFPVVGADLDDVRGVVHVKEVHGVPFEARATTPVADVMSPALVVPESRPLDDLLAELRRIGSHLAVVVDEYGGTAGIITLEDLLEEIVGEIDDEHDPPRLTVVERPGEWELDGAYHPDEVFDACGFVVPEGDYETLAGFVLAALGRVPDPGDHLEHDGWLLQVVEMDRLRVARVRLVKPRLPRAGEPGDDAAPAGQRGDRR